MMVTKSTKGVSPANSRGTSPQRANNNLSRNNSRKNVKSSPERTFKSSPNRVRNKSSSEERLVRSRGSSPAKTESSYGYPPSRGSDAGSIERLDESSHSRRIITSFNQTEDNINVVVRVRPLNPKEIKAGDPSSIQFPGSGQIVVDGVPNGGSAQKSKIFSYNVVFEPAATQEDVLQFSGIKRLLEMAVEGFRCTAFCYGQTGSGKTHTLTGPPGLFDKKSKQKYSDSHGLIFRSFMYLFQLIEEKPSMHFVLKASFLEIYNEKVIDLLNPGSARKPLAVRWSKKARGFFVENLFTVDCEELDDLTAVLEEGMRNRRVGSHNMNEHSSRSHTILSVHISSEQPAEDGVFISRSGKINFVDLAGSEMTKKTLSEGTTLEEANNINKSLMVLGYCISSLSDNKRKGSHIPYRDSKLTKLLADSLAGNGVTLMIACISPAKSNLTETINTLRYAARAKKIRTKPVVMMDPREALIISLRREVDVLQSENEHLRTALHLQSSPGDMLTEKRTITTPPQVDLEKLTELEGPQLVELVKLYVQENEALRKENMELYLSREMLVRDQELVCRENERLLKKLEDVNSVCCRSPINTSKRNSSVGNLQNTVTDFNLTNSNIWTNSSPSDNLGESTKSLLPEVIQKELTKRRIGSSLNNTQEMSHRRHNSLEDLRNSGLKPIRVKSSDLTIENVQNKYHSNLMNGERRFSMARSSEIKPENKPTLDSIMSSSPTFSDSNGIDSPNNWNAKNGSPMLNRKNKQNGLSRNSSGNLKLFGSTISLAENGTDGSQE